MLLTPADTKSSNVDMDVALAGTEGRWSRHGKSATAASSGATVTVRMGLEADEGSELVAFDYVMIASAHPTSSQSPSTSSNAAAPECPRRSIITRKPTASPTASPSPAPTMSLQTASSAGQSGSVCPGVYLAEGQSLSAGDAALTSSAGYVSVSFALNETSSTERRLVLRVSARDGGLFQTTGCRFCISYYVYAWGVLFHIHESVSARYTI